MQLGGPVWHASVRSLTPVSERTLRRMTATVLDGVGDPRLGEWWERPFGKAMHHRRRLSPAEQATVGGVVDIRGTPEAVARSGPLAALGLLAHVPADVLAEELGLSGGEPGGWHSPLMPRTAATPESEPHSTVGPSGG